jgi:hypothetical protein
MLSPLHAGDSTRKGPTVLQIITIQRKILGSEADAGRYLPVKHKNSVLYDCQSDEDDRTEGVTLGRHCNNQTADHTSITNEEIDAGGEACVYAEVPHDCHDLDVHTHRRQVSQRFKAIIGAAIVNEDRLACIQLRVIKGF